MEPSYTYNATLLGIHDGDTLTANIDLGFRISFTTPIRFARINAPELSTPEGKDALAYLQGLVGTNIALVIVSKKNPRDKYGRWLGEVYLLGATASLNQQMLDSGHAVPM